MIRLIAHLSHSHSNAAFTCNIVRHSFFCTAIISQARNISELEEAKLCNNRLLRRNSNLSNENQELYKQVDDLTNENRSLRNILLESSGDFKSNSGKRIPSINHAKDELMMELASVCKENKRLHIQIEKLKSSLGLKEKESKLMTRELTSLRDEIKEHVTREHNLGKVPKYLEESTEHTESSHITTDSPGSKRSDICDIYLTTDAIACTANSDKKVREELVQKGHGSTMMTSNEDGSIDDPLVLGKDQQQIDSDQLLCYCKESETIPNSINDLITLSERKVLESRIDSFQNVNKELTTEISALKNTNEEIKQNFTLKLKDLQIINSELKKTVNGYQEHEEQIAGIREKNYHLEVENGKLQKCMEDAAYIKVENEELKRKLEMKANECMKHEKVHEDKLQLEESLQEHVKLLELLQDENEMLTKKNEKLYQLEYNEVLQKSEIENLKTEISCFEIFVKEQAEEQKALQVEVNHLKRQIENKEKEIVQVRKKNSEIRAKLLDMAVEVEEVDRLNCENEQQRDTIANQQVLKAELATEVDSLRSKLGSLDRIRREHDELINELEMYKRKVYDVERKYQEAADLLVELDTKIDNTEEELAEANKLIEKLSTEKLQLIEECSSSAERIQSLKELLEKRSKDKTLLEKDAVRIQEDRALKTEVGPKQIRSIDSISEVLAKSKGDVACYMSEYLDHSYHSVRSYQGRLDTKAQETNVHKQIVEKEADKVKLELENAKLEVKYEALKEDRGFKNLGCADEKGDTIRDSSKVVRLFQERLDALMRSNFKLREEKIEMEKYVEEVMAENESLNAQISEVCNHTKIRISELFDSIIIKLPAILRFKIIFLMLLLSCSVMQNARMIYWR